VQQGLLEQLDHKARLEWQGQLDRQVWQVQQGQQAQLELQVRQDY
jgi:hypothetical protein